MRIKSKRFTLAVYAIIGLCLSLGIALGCAPEVGSGAWCEKMKETPQGDWSANDVSAYAKNCILK